MVGANPFLRVSDSTFAGRDTPHDMSHVMGDIGPLPGAPKDKSSIQANNDRLVDQNILPDTKINPSGDSIAMNMSATTAKPSESKAPDANASASHDGIPVRDQLLARAFGIDITANKDGSFNVRSPLDQNPVTMAGKIGQMIMSELMGGGGIPSSIPGLNPLLAASWKGWDMPPPPPEPAPPPEDPNAPW